MKKALLWVRTSTVRQEIESMTNELFDFASKFNYVREDCKVIGAQGASAIKADERYKQEMDELYRHLNTGEYDCVFAWELSRLGRREDYVISLKNYLIENHIQLRIAKPMLCLLEDDGAVNGGMELAISLLTTLAKQEMSVKKERFRRGHERVKAEGKFSGGKCLRFGYRLDDGGYIVEDEQQANIVRDIFDMYLNQGMSARLIYRHLNERGLMPDYKEETSGAYRILTILKSKTYAGIPDRGHKYPAIVTEEQVEAAISQAASNSVSPKTTSKYTCYCKGILICGDCGHVLCQQAGNCRYACSRHGHNSVLNINVMDYIAWECCKKYKPFAMQERNDGMIAQYQAMMDDELRACIGVDKKRRKLSLKIERLNELYIEGRLKKSDYEDKLKNLTQEGRKLDLLYIEHRHRLESAERLKWGCNEAHFDGDAVMDDKLRAKYIKETLRMKVFREGTGTYRIEVFPVDPIPVKDTFRYSFSGHSIKLIHENEGKTEDWSGRWPVKFRRVKK